MRLTHTHYDPSRYTLEGRDSSGSASSLPCTVLLAILWQSLRPLLTGYPGQDGLVGHRDGGDSEDGVAACFGAGHLMGDVKSSARSDSAGLATPATCLPRRPRVFLAPSYRLVLRVESVSKYQLVIRPGLPWHQGTPRAAVIARMKFSLAERVRLASRLPFALPTGRLPGGSRRPRAGVYRVEPSAPHVALFSSGEANQDDIVTCALSQ